MKLPFSELRRRTEALNLDLNLDLNLNPSSPSRIRVENPSSSFDAKAVAHRSAARSPACSPRALARPLLAALALLAAAPGGLAQVRPTRPTLPNIDLRT